MIKINGVTKYLGGQKILDALDLDIPDKKTIVIIGQSGCGKSVLLKHMTGLLKPDSGKILIENRDISEINDKEMDKIRIKIGMLFQGSALFDSLTVEENVGFALTRYSEKKPEEIKQIVKEKLALVGLENVEAKKPAELSGGMKKRVGLARAIAMDPKIMLYDEPTTGLDPIMSDVINELIINLHNKLQISSVVVTHDMKSAYKVGDRIAMMYEGKIVEEGTPSEIQNTKNPVVSQFINGSSNGPIQVVS